MSAKPQLAVLSHKDQGRKEVGVGLGSWRNKKWGINFMVEIWMLGAQLWVDMAGV